jgi:hypothetical protein
MDHNKLIGIAAKKALSPLGLRRQRTSRIWYDDHGWWAVVVEFQPSSWSRGSYLNVGLSWMLYEHAHWSFDIGSREMGFQSASEAQPFEAAITEMAAIAAQRVLDYRDRFSTLDKMCEHYKSLESREGWWSNYYEGVLSGLRGDRAWAEKHFSSVISQAAAYTWERALQFRCQDLMRLLGEPSHYRDSVLGIVLRCRSARCVEEMPPQEIGLP